jgi:hypothetical protein
MRNIGWFSWRSKREPFSQGHFSGIAQRVAGGFGAAILLTMTGIAAGQTPTPTAAIQGPEAQMSVPAGYTVHESVDVGGHMVGMTGSGAMYDTMVNMESGPRVLGDRFEMHALPGNKHALFDDLSAYTSGFGGDPNDFSTLNISKSKYYEFSGTFRRDRQYFDYDLLGNPNISTGRSIPVSGSSTPLAWPQVEQSPVMFNTVRRMTDTNLSIFPLARVTYRFEYSQGIFEGPSRSPGESVGKYDSLLMQYERNSTDDFIGGIDWKPLRGTKLTFEEEIDHYKDDTYFTLDPSLFMVQEADGTPVSLGDWDSQTAYGSSACNAGSMGGNPLLSAPQTSGGLPIINAACDVASSYLRSQPTRILYPTEIFRFQSSSIKNVEMNGDVRYTDANMNLPNYYESFQGFDYVAAVAAKAGPPPTPATPSYGIRSITFTGASTAKREVMAADYGIVWQASPKVSLSEQIDYSDVHQPGTSNISAGANEATPAVAYGVTNSSATINYSGQLSPEASVTAEGSANGTPLPDYFGQKMVTNNLGIAWDAWSRGTFSFTYRYRAHTIAEGIPDNIPLPNGADTGGTVTINENGGIFNAALHPTNNWDVSGSVEALYDDNAFTPVSPRQTRQYRVHTIYRAKPWATITGAFNDLERHNNTGDGATVTGSSYYGPIDHVDHSRVVSLGADVTPNEHYGFDFNYAYSDVYAATNICYDAGAASGLPGAATAPGSIPAGVAASGSVSTAASSYGVCAGVTAHGSSGLVDYWGRDFMDAPTQSGSVALMLSPVDKLHANLGYNVSSVNGSRFFNDARDVNGSLVSTYQTPYVDIAWTVHPGLIWKAEYNYYGYGEGGPSGAEYCSTSTSAAQVLCSSESYPTGMTEASSGLTAPRNFHANNVTLGVHYEF